jgi:F0F1-type ATP synthase assembly protein I
VERNGSKFERCPTESARKIGIFLALGTAIGAAIGVAMDNLAVGVGIGVAVGLILGAAIDRRGRE